MESNLTSQTCTVFHSFENFVTVEVEDLHRVQACENKDPLVLTCPEHHLIQVRSANYGRTDRSTCSTGPIETVNCINNVTEDVQMDCSTGNTCSLSPTNREYGDPCVGTYKYLDVYYSCHEGKHMTFLTVHTRDIVKIKLKL